MMKTVQSVLLIFFLTTTLYSFDIANNYQGFGFTENLGQWDNGILFRTSVPNGQMFFKKDKIGYGLYENYLVDHDVKDTFRRHNLILEFLRSRTSTISGEEKQSGYRNYMNGDSKNKHVSHVATYNKLTYHDLYNGIDMEVVRSGQGVKYQYLVGSNVSPDQIKAKYSGATKIELINGALRIITSVNEIVDSKPFAYQIINGEKVEVECEFVLNSTVVSFDIGDYDESLPLVIDPELIFSSYSGSPDDNWGNTACQDIHGNVLSAGIIFNIGDEFPTTTGAFMSSFNGGDVDILLYKLDSLGASLMFATYIGGNETEIPVSINVDPITNEIVMLAITGSGNFPVSPNAFDQSFGGGAPIEGGIDGFCDFREIWYTAFEFDNGSDLAVLKFDEEGGNMIGGTFYGGSRNEGVLYMNEPITKNYGDSYRGDIFVSEDHNIYIASNTRSTDLPVAGGFPSNYNGGTTDGVVAMFNSDLTSLIAGGYLGGFTSDAAYSVKVDDDGRIYVGGGTGANDFPLQSSSYNQEKKGGIDGFIATLDVGIGVVNSTLLGTWGDDQVYFLDINDEKEVFVLGQCTRPYSQQGNTYRYGNGLFLQKLNSNLSESIWSTNLGGTVSMDVTGVLSARPPISPTAFEVNECGLIMLAGWGGRDNSSSTTVTGCVSFVSNVVQTGFSGGDIRDLPITNDAYKSTTDGDDFYLALLSENAEDLLYATYFGGNGRDHVDGGTSRFDNKGNMVQAVCANCFGGGFPIYSISPGSDYPKGSNWSGCNNAVFKFSLSEMNLNLEVDDCSGLEPLIKNISYGGTRYEIDFGGGIVLNSFQNQEFNFQFDSPGVYPVKIKGYNDKSCVKEDSTTVEVRVIDLVEPMNVVDTLCVGEITQLTASVSPSDVSYQWQPSLYINRNDTSEVTFTAENSVSYLVVVTDSLGCTREDEFNLTIPKPNINIQANVIGNCEGEVPYVEFVDQSEDIIQYNWFIDNDSIFGSLSGYQFTDYGAYDFELIGGMEDCLDTAAFSVYLEELYVQNVVTPNSDGRNDQFKPQGIESSGAWVLEVYNRWGKQVYRNEDYLNEWSGKDQEDGTYYYLLTAPDGTFCKGWVQVIR